MGAGSEILTQVKNYNLKLVKTPISVRHDIDGGTLAKNPWRHGFGVLGSIIKQISEKRPLLYMGTLGLVLIMIGFFFGLRLLQLYNQEAYFSMPFTTLAGFFIIVGTLAVFMGLVLNVISKLVIEKEKT